MEKRWTHEGTECLMRTGPMGNLNGYIGVEKGHPWWGETYWDLDVDVHGGLTYTGEERPGTWDKDGRWWLGFDTAHAGDVVPKIEELLADHYAEGTLGGAISDAMEGDVLRGEPYVEEQIKSLVMQAQADGGTHNGNERS